MELLTGPATVAAALLALAGAQKMLDPTMTVGALRSLRLPAGPAVVRAGSGAEALLGVSAIVVGYPALWLLVALSYLAFSGVVIAAMRSGAMIGSCGCFGREETPPHWVHVVLNGLLAAVGVAAALRDLRPPMDALTSDPVEGLIVGGLGWLAVYLLYALYVELPRSLRAASPARQ